MTKGNPQNHNGLENSCEENEKPAVSVRVYYNERTIDELKNALPELFYRFEIYNLVLKPMFIDLPIDLAAFIYCSCILRNLEIQQKFDRFETVRNAMVAEFPRFSFNSEQNLSLFIGKKMFKELRNFFSKMDPFKSMSSGDENVIDYSINLTNDKYEFLLLFYLDINYNQQQDIEKKNNPENKSHDELYYEQLESAYKRIKSESHRIKYGLSRKERENPDALLAELTKRKITYHFHRIDEEELLRILVRNNFDYSRSVQALKENKHKMRTAEGSEEPPLPKGIFKKVVDDFQASRLLKNIKTKKNPKTIVVELTKHVLMRNSFIKKINRYRDSVTFIALKEFYMERVLEQSLYIEQIKLLMASMPPMALPNLKTALLNDVLDLHFLYSAEALVQLDLFLDIAIQIECKENEKDEVYLTLITGNGNHSVNNIAKLKMLSEKRLTERQLTYRMKHNNLGVLIIILDQQSELSHD